MDSAGSISAWARRAQRRFQEKFGMHKVHESAAAAAPQINFDQFLAVDIRVGTIVAAEPYPEARIPSLKLTIDFGAPVGTKRSSAQIAQLYQPDELIGRQFTAA